MVGDGATGPGVWMRFCCVIETVGCVTIGKMKLTGLRFNGTSASSDITKVGLRAILPIQRQWVSAVCYTRAFRGAS